MINKGEVGGQRVASGVKGYWAGPGLVLGLSWAGPILLLWCHKRRAPKRSSEGRGGGG